MAAYCLSEFSKNINIMHTKEKIIVNVFYLQVCVHIHKTHINLIFMKKNMTG